MNDPDDFDSLADLDDFDNGFFAPFDDEPPNFGRTTDKTHCCYVCEHYEGTFPACCCLYDASFEKYGNNTAYDPLQTVCSAFEEITPLHFGDSDL